ncbi:MAG: hypothetical protein OXI43_18870 [Candidatus Poribacteria bacterium]|nr:hypothetical protein [Candidatus Poribacteria bacterium]
MKTKRCILTLILFSLVFYVLPVDAHDPGLLIETAKSDQFGKYGAANEADKRLIEAQSLMALLALKYDLKQAEIQNGTQVLLSDVFTGAVAVAVTAATGGAAASVMVPTALSSLVKSLGLAASINSEAGVLSAYEAAIDETISRIATAKTAVTNYENSWNAYDTLVRTHNDAGPHKNSESGDHPIDDFIPISPNYNLPSYPCGGSCNQSFTKPTSPHWVKCGTAMDVDKESLSEMSGYGTRIRSVGEILKSRSVSDGCGRNYYNCKDEAKHGERTCNLWVWEKPSGYLNAFKSYRCGRKFRKCMGHTFDHNPDVIGSAKHSDEGDGGSGEEGSTEEQTIAPTSQVDNSPNCEHCTTGGCSSCPITYACGVHSGHPSEASSHAMQASCSLSNNWMQTCTVTNFYACQTHTCVFPTVPCGNASCTQSVAFREEHRRWCINANKYWSCSTTQPMDPNEYHRTRTCTRYKALRQERDPLTGLNTVVWGTCGEQWDMCDTRCWNVTGGFGTHQE